MTDWTDQVAIVTGSSRIRSGTGSRSKVNLAEDVAQPRLDQ